MLTKNPCPKQCKVATCRASFVPTKSFQTWCSPDCTVSRNQKALQMLKDVRCGKCNRLLARAAGVTQLQIKCSRCGALNHVRALSSELSPLSDMQAKSFAKVI